MRLLRAGLLAICLIGGALPVAVAQETPAQPQDQFFSGVIESLSADKVTVNRTVLGKTSERRTFLITPETRVEGRPRVKVRVTVRYATGDDGDRALHMIVRPAQKK